MAEDCEPTNRRGIMEFMQEHKVKEITDHALVGITSNGVDLTDKYADGIRTLLGIHTQGFPNLFIMGGYH